MSSKDLTAAQLEAEVTSLFKTQRLIAEYGSCLRHNMDTILKAFRELAPHLHNAVLERLPLKQLVQSILVTHMHASSAQPAGDASGSELHPSRSELNITEQLMQTLVLKSDVIRSRIVLLSSDNERMSTELQSLDMQTLHAMFPLLLSMVRGVRPTSVPKQQVPPDAHHHLDQTSCSVGAEVISAIHVLHECSYRFETFFSLVEPSSFDGTLERAAKQQLFRALLEDLDLVESELRRVLLRSTHSPTAHEKDVVLQNRKRYRPDDNETEGSQTIASSSLTDDASAKRLRRTLECCSDLAFRIRSLASL